MNYKPYGGTYRPTRETYPLMEALSVAVAVDREQGFIKSGNSFYNKDGEPVADNRTATLTTLRVMHEKLKQPTEPDAEPYRVVEATQADHEAAAEIFDYFDQILLMDKLSDNLVKQGRDGRVNDFNLQLSKIFAAGEVDANKHLAMIVSLPNSRRVAAKREEMDEFYQTHQMNGFIGEVKQRIKVSGLVKDVKYLPNHKVHLATFVTEDGKIGKFFINDKLSKTIPAIVERNVSFIATVKKQDVNTLTGCQETVFNRIKIADE